MRQHRIKRPLFWGGALIALLVLLLAVACASGVPTKDYDAVKQQLSEKDAALAKAQGEAGQLKQQLASVAPGTIVQAGQLQPAPAGAQPTGWDTKESIRGGLKLVATYDSSGPDAWDVKAHPMVYFTSTGGTGSDGKPLFQGLHIIDAYSKQVIASANYDLGSTTSPHTVGVSPDGKWAYLQGQRMLSDGKTTEAVTLIINARTLKLAKLLKQESMMQGSLREQRLHHVTGFIDSKGRDRVVLEYGFGSTGGPHFIVDPKDDNRVVKAITLDDTGYWMGHPFVTVDPTGKYLFVSLKMTAWADVTHDIGGVAKINLETNAITVIPGVGDHLIGMMTTADGKFLYVNDGENSKTYKIDLTENKVVGKTSCNVAGCYGLALSWDEKLLYTVGKGEGAANQGHVLGVIDTTTFRPAASTLLGVNQPIELGEGSRTADHAFLHPDPKVNELWISNMAGTVTTVLDLKTNTVKARIPVPGGGNSTHSGAFVRYNPDWTGQVLADHGGPKAEMLAIRKEMAAKAVLAK
ncbi:MAG: hypothetical protein HYU29_07560 [Chloroflexi bacterium]|nr:hypothetical protein [Chloroflexota bacterium]